MTPDTGDPMGRASDASASIAGRVLRTGSRPEPGASVMITGDSPDHPDLAQVTGEDGTFVFAGLLPGRYTLAAYAEDGASGAAPVEVGAGEAAGLDIPIRG